MTNELQSAIPNAAREWATQQLEVPTSASSAEIKRAYLKRLRDEDFVPPRTLSNSFQLLTTKRVALDDEWLTVLEDRLKAEVESFGAEFFAIPSTERMKRWEELCEKCRIVPQLRARLETMRPGLRIENVQITKDDPFRQQLEDHLLRIFPASRLMQTASRQALLQKIENPANQADLQKWEKAAQSVMNERKDLGALNPSFLRYLTNLRTVLRREKELRRRAETPSEPQTSGVFSFLTGNAHVFYVLVGIMILRVIFVLATSPPSTPTFARRPFPMPEFYQPPPTQTIELLSQPWLNQTSSERSMAIFGRPDVPLKDLFDESKYSREVVYQSGICGMNFTPRPSSTTQDSRQKRPIWVGEPTLRIMGLSQKTLDDLFEAHRALNDLGLPKKTVSDLFTEQKRSNDQIRSKLPPVKTTEPTAPKPPK